MFRSKVLGYCLEGPLPVWCGLEEGMFEEGTFLLSRPFWGWRGF